MRLTKLISWLLLCGTLAFFAVSAQAQPNRSPGQIYVAKLTGQVTAIDLGTRQSRPLAEKESVTQNTQIVTGAGSSVILVFSNGASLNIGSDSSMDIEEFLQDPFQTGVAVATLEQEPTSSTTRVRLNRGELVGNVKKLNAQAGSSFTVQTPVGAAGIRGTTFRIVFRADESGRVFFTLTTAEGVVLLQVPAAADVPVETGNEVVVSVDVTVDPTTGTVTLNAPPTVEGLAPASMDALAAIEAAAQDIVEASANLIISSVSTTTTDSGGPAQGEGESENQQQESENEQGDGDNSTNNPLETGVPDFGPTNPPPRTTDADGKTV
jgi:Uncharacterized protein conserved in bacteria